MPGPFDIRRLAAGDAAFWREIRLAALQGSPEAFSSNYETEAARPLEAFAERLETSVVLAACREGRIVGVAGLGGNERRRGFLWGMYVRPEARRLGAAGLLLDAILAAASERFEQIELDVAAGNSAALALYEKFGFVRFGTAPRALKTASGYQDEILMVKFLDAAEM
jgi:ribosomal protein S18 acetylase RimI-like enzyme